MSQRPEGERQRRTAATTATTTEEPSRSGSELFCSCCVPANPLVLRPDLGTEPDGSATWALCVFHAPEPAVYRVREGGGYEWVPDLRLNELGEIARASGEVVARVLYDGFQRLTTVDDDDLPQDPGSGGGGGGAAARPAPLVGGERAAWSGTRVDLAQDEFYGRCAAGRPAGAP